MNEPTNSNEHNSNSGSGEPDRDAQGSGGGKLHHWDPDNLLASLTDEKQTLGENEAQVANRLFTQGLMGAAMAIVHMSVYAPNEKIRLQAAQYVVERNLGKIGDPTTAGKGDPFEDLLADCVKYDGVPNN